jgi:hypothetical protein
MFDGIKSIQSGHENIEQHDIEGGLLQRANPGIGPQVNLRFEAVPGEYRPDRGGDALIVVNDKDPCQPLRGLARFTPGLRRRDIHGATCVMVWNQAFANLFGRDRCAQIWPLCPIQ